MNRYFYQLNIAEFHNEHRGFEQMKRLNYTLSDQLCNKQFHGTVASLGLVSPAAATDGCHPIFTFFS